MDGELVEGPGDVVAEVVGGAAGEADPRVADHQDPVEVAVDAPGATRTYSYHVTRPLDQLAVHSISAALPLP